MSILEEASESLNDSIKEEIEIEIDNQKIKLPPLDEFANLERGGIVSIKEEIEIENENNQSIKSPPPLDELTYLERGGFVSIKEEIEIENENNQSIKPPPLDEFANLERGGFVSVKEEIEIDNENNQSIKPPPLDELTYLERGGFSSDMYRIEVFNLPRFCSIEDLRNFLTVKLFLKPIKIKSQSRRSKSTHICFANEEEKLKALKALEGYIWEGRILRVQSATPAPDPLVKRRNDEINASSNKKPKLEDIAKIQDEKLKNFILHYWNIPYEEQVQKKEEEMRNILMLLGNGLTCRHPELKSRLEALQEKFKGLICNYKGIRSPVQVEGYRNKCQFMVGIDAVTQLPTVGYRLGGHTDKATGVAPVDNMINTPEDVKKAAAYFQEFVRKSEYPVYSFVSNSGYWRQFTVRKSWKTGKLMVMIGIDPQVLTDAQLEKIKQSLKVYFSGEEAKSLNIASVYFYLMKKRVGNEKWLPEHMLGDTHLTEEILGMTFRLSPETFFQANSEGAELLYKSALELVAPTLETTVLDICCGTGTIGLCFANSCKKVYGIDVSPEAIKTAKTNTAINNVTNCEWFVGKAEDLLGTVLSQVGTPDVIAIVDPPRTGLFKKGVVQLRISKKVKRVLYVCCDAKASLPSVMSLCRPPSDSLRGVPFLPTAAVTIDLFPFTKHVELLILLERNDLYETEDKDEKTTFEMVQSKVEIQEEIINAKNCTN